MLLFRSVALYKFTREGEGGGEQSSRSQNESCDVWPIFFLDFPATLLYLYTNCSNVKNQLRVLSSQIFDPKFSPLTFYIKNSRGVLGLKILEVQNIFGKKIPHHSSTNFPPLGSVNFQGGKNWVEMQKIQCEIMFYWRKTTFHWMAITRLGLHSSYLT